MFLASQQSQKLALAGGTTAKVGNMPALGLVAGGRSASGFPAATVTIRVLGRSLLLCCFRLFLIFLIGPPLVGLELSSFI